MDTTTPHPLLQNALRANALFSTISALVSIIAAGSLAALLGIDAKVLLTVGVGLLGFAAYVFWVSSNPVRTRGQSLWIIIADVAWVAGSVLLIFTDVFTPSGNKLVLVVALIVAGLAAAQWLGLKRIKE